MANTSTYRPKRWLQLMMLCVSLLLMNGMQAQSKKTVQVLANTRLLEKTVFGSKDSVTLEKLFAKPLVYIHSTGRTENREQAIKAIVNNRSTYTTSPGKTGYEVSEVGDSVLVMQVFKAVEKKEDGTESQLSISIETVWAKEKGEWKLFRRIARKAD